MHRESFGRITESGIDETVNLGSSTGLEIDMRVRRPLTSQNEKLPVFVIVGGHRTGKDAVDLVDVSRRAAYVAIDYPYDGPRSLRGVWAYYKAVPRFQQAFLDTPPALSLVVDWLKEQNWVDAGRIELLGISLGVPFAAVAGAMDVRFARVWLVHGGADNASWLTYAARNAIDSPTLRRVLAESLLFLVYGNSFDTKEWIHEIAPRPLVIVAARDDERVPIEAQQPFIDAADSDSIELIWVDGLHVDPDRPEVVQELMNIVFRRALPES